MRVLFVDASRGASAASLLAALIDLGVAPSPILHALGGMDLPVEARFTSCADGTTTWLAPERAPMPVPVDGVRDLLARAGLPDDARRVAEDAVGRLLVAELAGRDSRGALVDAGALACLAGAAMGLAALAPERVLASRVGVAADPDEPVVDLLADWAHALDFGAGACAGDGAALLRALASEDAVGRAEPAWRGVVSRGRACGGAPMAVALGEAAEPAR